MKTLGQVYEDIAARWLRRNGFVVLHRNYKTRWGEIDIIARKKDVLHFVEVKGRARDAWYSPEEAVHAGKLRRIRRTATMFISSERKDRDFSIDVLAITRNGPEPTIEFFENVTAG